MQFFILIISLATVFYTPSCADKLTAEEFSLKFIENSLNSTKDTENFVIAPYEAFNLYKELYSINEDNERDQNGVEDGNDDDNDSHEITTVKPAIRQERKTLTSSAANLNDLLSTVSLTARWSFNFQTRDTHKKVFHQHGAPNQKIWMDFLRKDDTFYYSHDDQLNASILELPLNVKAIKLTLILPDKWDNLPDLKDYLLENMNVFTDVLKGSHKMTLVRVMLPKFHLNYKINLKDFFNEMSSMDLEKYENIYQSSNLEFNERGIGRFERTTVLFWNAFSNLRVSPQIFDLSHPFLFLITNKDGIQFFGQVVKMHH